MGYRTPLGRAKGLGTAKEGVSHWWWQRVTAVMLLPLCLIVAFAVLQLPGLAYTDIVSWLRQPCIQALTGLFIAAGFFHASLGLQVVIEDYVRGFAIRTFSVLLMKVTLFTAALAMLLALVKL